jgi:DNA-directed RNA polymerase specialized sigma24 family protein
MGNEQDALDAFQDSFAKAFAAMPGLEKLTNFYPWFYRVLRNCCLNMLERRNTRERYAEFHAAPLHPEHVTPASILEQSSTVGEFKRPLGQILPLGCESNARYDRGFSHKVIMSLHSLPSRGGTAAQPPEIVGVPASPAR